MAEEGETLLELAMRSGVHINASCGGNGACGKCRVRIVEGEASGTRHPKVSEEEYAAGVRLACMTVPETDLLVEIPLETQVDRGALRRRAAATAALKAADLDRLVSGWSVDPSVFKRYVELPPPSIDDNVADLTRLARELKRQHAIEAGAVDPPVLRTLARPLREGDWKVTVTLEATAAGCRIIAGQPGDRAALNYSLVIDIGTTTVCGQLLDLGHCDLGRTTGKVWEGLPCTIADHSEYNGQISYGEDVISRIMYSQKAGGLERLQGVIVETINTVIGELFAAAPAAAEDVSHMVVAGNTTMTQLLLGLSPRYLMLSPYTPLANSFPPVRAKDLGIAVKEHVHLSTFPCVASYVGGDIVAGVLGSGMFQRDELALFIDVGTNGEIVVGNREWLTCASCSAGPAFEGGGITFGMRADTGAIEQVRIDPVTFEPMILTVGRGKPAGICGSGLIDCVAELYLAGLVDANGKFGRDLQTRRVRQGESGYEYVICFAEESSIGKDIVLNEVDLDNLIRAKAALYAGCRVLLDTMNLSFDDIARVIIAGGFGHHLNVEKAKIIGLLPDVPPDRFLFVGNGSLLGARLFSFSGALARKAGEIASMMTNLELSNSPVFMDEFIAAQFIPHTHQETFSSVMEMVRARRP